MGSDTTAAAATTAEPSTPRHDDGVTVEDLWAKKGREVGKRWLFRVYDRRSGKRISKAFADGKKADGWDWADDIRAAITRGERRAGALPFALVAKDYVDALKERGLNEAYRDEVERVAAAVVAAGAVDLHDEDFAKKVRTWLANAPRFPKRKRGQDPKTVPAPRLARDADDETPAPSAVTKNRWLIELRSIAKHAVRKYGLRTNPLTMIGRFKVDETIKPTLRLDELRAIVADDRRGDPYHLVAAVLVYAGLRVGEAMHLRWEWIDLEAGTITIRVIRDAKGVVVWAPKRNKERVIPLQRELAEILRAVPERPRAGWVIADATLRGMEAKNQWTAFRAYLDRCLGEGGARDLHPHCTRHTWTVLMLETGASPSLIRRALGHASLVTTDGYANALGSYTQAVRAWPRGEFCLRRPPSAIAADPLAQVRELVAGGDSVAAIARRARMPEARLARWLHRGPPRLVRQYAALLAGARGPAD